MPSSLFTAKRYVELLATLPGDTGRDDRYTTMLKRERQYTDVMSRADAIDDRVRAITEALPDANAKERSTLLAERRDLLAERYGLPLDAAVAARLYATAVADFGESVQSTIDKLVQDVRAELAPTDKALAEARYSVSTTAPDHPAFEERYARLRDVMAQRKPHVDRADELRELAELTTEYTKSVLREGASATGHQAVKVVKHRPIQSHIAGFVDAASRKVAS